MLSKFLLMLIKLSNRLMKRTHLIFYDPDIGETEEDNAITKDVIKKLFPEICHYVTKYDCYCCELSGDKTFDFWCTCKVLIYLNKSILNLWRDKDGT